MARVCQCDCGDMDAGREGVAETLRQAQCIACQVFGGMYTLAGGFWGGGAVAHNLFLPLILR